MRIALVELSSRDRLNIYALIKMARGIPLLAAILKKLGYSVDCFVETVQKFDSQELLGYDLIGFSIISCTANPTYLMIKELRKSGYKGKIAVGGPHATVLPDESLDAGADMVVRHEGDKTFPALLQVIEHNSCLENVLGITWKTPSGNIQHNPDQPLLNSEELSNLPLPAFETIRGHQKIHQLPLMFSRGCPYDCVFCAVRNFFGPYRFTTTSSRMSQLKTLRDTYPWFWENCTMFFADDNFFGTHESQLIANEMLRRMPAENLVPPKGWVCQMRVTDANLETAQLLKNAGCIIVCLGIESTDAVALKSIHKGQTPEDISNGLSELHSQGIDTLAMTIAGIDTDTFWSFFRGIRKLREWGITYLQILAMVPLPGTKLTNQLLAKGVKISRNYDYYNGMHVLLKPAKMSKFSVWLAVYLVTIWFYFFTTHGLMLFVKRFKYYIKMMFVMFRQTYKI